MIPDKNKLAAGLRRMAKDMMLNGMKQYEVATYFGIQESMLSRFLKNERQLKLESLFGILEKTGLKYDDVVNFKS